MSQSLSIDRKRKRVSDPTTVRPRVTVSSDTKRIGVTLLDTNGTSIPTPAMMRACFARAVSDSEDLVRQCGYIDWSSVKPCDIGNVPLWLSLKHMCTTHDADTTEHHLTQQLSDPEGARWELLCSGPKRWWQGHTHYNLPERTSALNIMWTNALRYCLARETVQSAIILFDRFMMLSASSNFESHAVAFQSCKVHISCMDHVTLIAIACLSLTVKLEECYIPEPSDWVESCDQAFSITELMQTERLILERSQWNIRVQTPCAWLRHYLVRLAHCVMQKHQQVLEQIPAQWTMRQIQDDINVHRQTTMSRIVQILSVSTMTRLSQLLDMYLLHPSAPHCSAADMAVAALFTHLPNGWHADILQITQDRLLTIQRVVALDDMNELNRRIPAISGAPLPASSTRGQQYEQMKIPVYEQWARFQHPLHGCKNTCDYVVQLLGLDVPIRRQNQRLSLTPTRVASPTVCSPMSTPSQGSSSPATPTSHMSSMDISRSSFSSPIMPCSPIVTQEITEQFKGAVFPTEDIMCHEILEDIF